MVARIIFGKQVGKAIRYNENKVQEKIATCLQANGIGWNDTTLSAQAKERFFQDLTSRNQGANTNALHISLNFHPSEKDRLTDNLLQEIVARYMEGIGFGDQPFLVYRHTDTHHPHVHIVTTNIRYDGTQINTQWIRQRKSEPTRMFLEKEYGLIPASGRVVDTLLPFQALEDPAMEYGESELKAKISNIVRDVVNTYQFTSLQEFNAILEQYNVYADGGAPNSKLDLTEGLVFWEMNRFREKLGKGIKASIIYGKPTKEKLTELYEIKKSRRSKFKARLVRVVDDAIAAARNQEQFAELLATAKVQVKFHLTEKGDPFGITFIDNLTRCVFKGSDLKKGYSAKKILEKITSTVNEQQQYNFLLLQKVLGSTDFANKPETILRSWRRQGLKLVKIQQKSSTKYLAGYYSLPPESFTALPETVQKWLRSHEPNMIDNSTSGKTKSVFNNADFMLEVPASFLSLLEQHTASYGFLLDPVYAHSSMPRELLQEARKKKKKKRR
ncbi:relaxase/mobilization nuclease domain-containing protein [Chitinophaga pollutisoli]|uniref:Relaxase/mobilization nuclease domain-containing protein n=1 Tax=Chitinophaga pollutisoli TaxID=3133966 RepID=A0ABZ2YQC0_9BACT